MPAYPVEPGVLMLESMALALGGGVFRFHPGVSYRHIMVVGGHPELLRTRYAPPHDISGKPIAEYLPSGVAPITLPANNPTR